MSAQEDEEPLDPKVEAIRQKMVRLLMISGGIMMFGLMAVLLAIVYKINKDPISLKTEDATPRQNATAGPASTAKIAIDKGSRILSASASDGGLLVVLETVTGSTEIRRFDTNGRLLNRYFVSEE